MNALEAIFLAEGSSAEEIEAVKQESDGLGLFVRSLTGLDRQAAKNALSGFMQGRSLTANQIEFVNLIINHLALRGWIDVSLLYDSPFTDVHPHGIDGIFDDSSTLRLISILQSVRQNAVGIAL